MGWQSWDKGICRIDWSQRVKDRTNGIFELVERTIDDTHESKLKIRCVKCGYEKTINASSIRGTNKVRCVVCDMKQTEDRINFEKEQRKVLRETKRKQKRKQVAFKCCEDCGSIISFGHRRLCDSCREQHKKKAQHKYVSEQSRLADVKRRARMRKVKHDKGLTKQKLYERDNGICYLCGKLCDWNDGKWENGVFKVGKTYPTVEHLIPIFKGGDDTWDNVKLACHSCNSKKGRKSLEEYPPCQVG